MICILNYDQIWSVAIKVDGGVGITLPKKEKVTKNKI
jgi:hypothetical protein